MRAARSCARRTASRTRPVERNVLARVRRPLELVAECIHAADGGLAPRDELWPRPRLAARGVHELRILARPAGRPGQGLRPRPDLPGDLRSPVRAVWRDLERDAGALYSANLTALGKQRGDLGGKSADAAPENERQRLGLTFVGALIDEE